MNDIIGFYIIIKRVLPPTPVKGTNMCYAHIHVLYTWLKGNFKYKFRLAKSRKAYMK